MDEITPLKAIEILKINLEEAKKMPPDVKDALHLAIKHLFIAVAKPSQNPTIPLPTPLHQDFRHN